MISYRYAALTDVGLRRSDNQDSGFASSRLLLIADGMGGAAAGDLASSETTHIMRRLDAPLEGDAAEALAGAVHRANDRLAELIEDDPSVEGMGTTLTAMLFDGEKFTLAHVGDSRAYCLRDGALTQLSDDHTFVQSLVDEGRITREEARDHPHRSLILRALLGRDEHGPDLLEIEPEVGDRYLLCSDGLTDMVEDAAIAHALGQGSVDEAAVELVRLALDGGGVDNVTVVLAEVIDDTDATAPLERAAVDSDDVEAMEAEQTHSSDDRRPQLVGAAAAGPQPKRQHTQIIASSKDGETGEVDPEEARYAPQAPSRWRWLRISLIVLLVLGLLAGGAWFAYDWSQKQYFVAEDDGNVAIFRGIDADVPGVSLSRVDTRSDIPIDTLPTPWQNRVRDGIGVADRAEADDTVENLCSESNSETVRCAADEDDQADDPDADATDDSPAPDPPESPEAP